MQSSDCVWFLVKFGDDDFAVQYTGEDPDRDFPIDISGLLYTFELTDLRNGIDGDR